MHPLWPALVHDTMSSPRSSQPPTFHSVLANQYASLLWLHEHITVPSHPTTVMQPILKPSQASASQSLAPAS